MTERRRHPWYVHLVAFLLSPIVEKNPMKSMAWLSPIMLSGSRITVAVFTYVMARRLIDVKMSIGWPEATSVLGLIFALPLLAALEKVSPEEVVAFGAKIIDRYGIGDVAAAAITREPNSRFDDERGEHQEREDVG